MRRRKFRQNGAPYLDSDLIIIFLNIGEKIYNSGKAATQAIAKLDNHLSMVWVSPANINISHHKRHNTNHKQ